MELRCRGGDGRGGLFYFVGQARFVDGEQDLSFADLFIVAGKDLVDPARDVGSQRHDIGAQLGVPSLGRIRIVGVQMRSEERRVGKEWVSTCRSRWSQHT